MERFSIDIDGHEIEYEFKRRRRSRHIRVTVSASGRACLNVPYFISRKKGEEFMREKSAWLLGRISEAEASGKIALGEDREDYLRNKDKALVLAKDRLDFFNDSFYHFKVAKVSVANQKSRWGSCSASGTIRYNYKIIYLPPQIQDYIIVHELCHIKEMNHSKDFWALVSKAIPNWAIYRRQLRLH